MDGRKGRTSTSPGKRAEVLAGASNLKMARSAHAHTRGSTAKSYEWLATEPASIPSPTWLWSSVVALLSIHEGAYLEHCRLFALRKAA